MRRCAGRPLERRPARFGSYRNGRRSRIHQLTIVPRLGIGSCDRRHQLYLPIPIIFWTPLKSVPVAEFFWRWELAAEKGEVAGFLTHMPANTVIFITMAVLGLAATLIALRS